jgi:hypothetical protein
MFPDMTNNFLNPLTLSLAALGQLAQPFFDGQSLTKNLPIKFEKKYLFVCGDLWNAFYFRQLSTLFMCLQPLKLHNLPKSVGLIRSPVLGAVEPKQY